MHGALFGEILLNLVSETGDGERLQPDAAGAGERGEKDAVAAEDHVFDAGDALNLERDGGLEGADVAGMDAEEFAGGEVFDDELAGEFEPGYALAADLLQEEAVAAEDARAERLLEADAEFDAGGGAEEAVTVLVAGADVDGNDVAGDAGGEGDLAGAPMARYSVMKREPPPATRLIAPKMWLLRKRTAGNISHLALSFGRRNSSNLVVRQFYSMPPFFHGSIPRCTMAGRTDITTAHAARRTL